MKPVSEKKPASVTIQQFNNPKFSREDAPEEKNSANWVYKVKASKNTLAVSIGQWLLPSEVQSLIDNGVDISIK